MLVRWCYGAGTAPKRRGVTVSYDLQLNIWAGTLIALVLGANLYYWFDDRRRARRRGADNREPFTKSR